MNRSPIFVLPPPAAAESPNSVRPLWLVYVAAVLSGLAVLVGSAAPSVARVPALAATSAVVFGVFGAACAWLLGRIHYFRPLGWDVKTLSVLWGAFAAIGYALPANRAIHAHFAGSDDASTWSLFAPFTEEPVKDIGIVVVLLLAATRPRTALDGLVVGSFVGLGFEAVENVIQSVNNAIASSPPGHPEQWASLATDVIHEVLRRSWTGHIIITGVAGFGIAYAMTAPRRAGAHRWAVASALVLLAFAAHLLWNSHRFGVFYVVGQFAVLAVFLWLIRVGRVQESKLYLPFLSWVTPPVIDPALARSLGSATARRAYRKGARNGAASRKGARSRQQAAARLAAALANGDVGQAHECADRLIDAAE